MTTYRTTLKDAYSEYLNQLDSKDISSFRNSILRYVVTGITEQIPNSRMTPSQMKRAELFLDSILLTKVNKAFLRKYQNIGFKLLDIKKPNQRRPRSILNKFLDWGDRMDIFKKDSSSDVNKNSAWLSYHKKIIDRSFYEKNKTRKKPKPKISISLDEKSYLKNYSEKYPEHNEKELIQIISKDLKNIKSQMKKYKKFLFSRSNAKDTIDRDLRTILALIGWYSKKNNIPLKNINFDNIIKIINIYPSMQDDFNKYLIEEGKARYQAKEEGKILISFLEDFFEDYKITNPETKQHYIVNLISLLKFSYKNITDKTQAKDCEDIPQIQALKIFRTQLPLGENKKITVLPLNWAEVIQVVLEAKKEADVDTRIYKDSNGCIKKETSKRKMFVIATSLQRFLILGFLTFLPPDRQRTLRELKINKSFKLGTFTKQGLFIPKEDMANNKEAKYYIHLGEEDFKTGKFYGEVIIPIPNPEFADGTKFYNYIDKWIFQGFRQSKLDQFQQKDHGYLFLQSTTGLPMKDSSSIHSITTCFFRRKTGVEVNPHLFRAIYRTFIVNRGMTKKEEESTLFLMHHDEKTAQKHYTFQTLEEKIKPGLDLIAKINSEILLNF